MEKIYKFRKLYSLYHFQELVLLYPNTEIRYSLDGQEPSLESPLYQKPFILKNNTIIRAALFLENKKIENTYSA